MCLSIRKSEREVTEQFKPVCGKISEVSIRYHCGWHQVKNQNKHITYTEKIAPLPSFNICEALCGCITHNALHRPSQQSVRNSPCKVKYNNKLSLEENSVINSARHSQEPFPLLCLQLLVGISFLLWRPKQSCLPCKREQCKVWDELSSMSQL